MKMRNASEQDLAAIMAIEHQAHASPWPESIMRNYLQRPNSAWLLQNEQGDVLAYAVNTLVAGEAELLTIAVDPRLQGQGYGYQLLQQLHDYLAEHQAEQWFLDVRVSNFKAIKLYESFGFNQAGRRPNYYPSKTGREDALLYCFNF